MGNQVWQTASIFISLSLAGIVFLGQSTGHSWTKLVVVSVVSLASISILGLWARILRRWTSFDAITQYRMREIESELGMWKNRYIDHMDTVLRGDPAGEDGADDELKSRLDRLVRENRHHYSSESGGRAVTLIRRILVLTWLVLFAQEIVFTVLQYYPIAVP